MDVMKYPPQEFPQTAFWEFRVVVTTRQDIYIDLAYRFLLPLVHSKFSSDKGLLTIAKKILKSVLNYRGEPYEWKKINFSQLFSFYGIFATYLQGAHLF